MTKRGRPLPALALVLMAPVLPGFAAEAVTVGAGQKCGGVSGVQCELSTWCEPPAGQCNVSDLEGTCVRAGTVCTMEYRPVCACSGMTYGNDCHRRLARAQKRHDGACR